MMSDQRPRVAIVGAGPSGLAAAYHLADSHRVWLLDSRSAVGGVWAQSSNQAYDWLETNTPTALFPFPGFPMVASDWAEGSHSSFKPPPYVSSRAARRYYARFAQEKRLDERGRLESLRLGTTVINVRRSGQEGMANHGRSWLLTCRDLSTGAEETLAFERLVIAAGPFYAPSIPDPLRGAIDEGVYAFHSSSLGSPIVASRLSRAKKVVIVGGGKSALDMIARVMSSRASKASRPSIVVVLPPHDRISAWPLPHGRGPSYLSRLPLLGARYLSPWAGSSPSLLATWLQQSRFGRALCRLYWSSLARQARTSFALVFQSTDSQAELWRDIMRSTSRLFPAPPGLTLATQQAELSILHATLDGVVTDVESKATSLTLTLSDGSAQSIAIDGETGLVVACTGYLTSSCNMAHIFADESEARKLGIPAPQTQDPSETDDAWQDMVQAAIHAARKGVPMLADLFSEEEVCAPPQSTFRLYHHMVPIEQAHTSAEGTTQRDFAILGLPQTLSAAVVADVQARWLSRFFSDEHSVSQGPLRLPSGTDEAAQETARLIAASIARYGLRDARQGTTMSLELAWYAGSLLSDLRELQKQRTSLLRPFRALGSEDFL